MAIQKPPLLFINYLIKYENENLDPNLKKTINPDIYDFY